MPACPLFCGHVVFSGGYYSVRQERWAPQSYLDYYSPLTYTIIVLTDWVTEVVGAYSMVSPQCGLP